MTHVLKAVLLLIALCGVTHAACNCNDFAKLYAAAKQPGGIIVYGIDNLTYHTEHKQEMDPELPVAGVVAATDLHGILMRLFSTICTQLTVCPTTGKKLAAATAFAAWIPKNDRNTKQQWPTLRRNYDETRLASTPTRSGFLFFVQF